MLECPNCGNRIAVLGSRCRECGADLNQILPPPPLPPPPPIEPVIKEDKRKQGPQLLPPPTHPPSEPIKKEVNIRQFVMPPLPPIEPEFAWEKEAVSPASTSYRAPGSETSTKTRSKAPLYAITTVLVAILIILAALQFGFFDLGNLTSPGISDTDGDGYDDNVDDFVNDPTEWRDTDKDGVGDNSDAFPNDPYEWDDTDGDGIGDNGDPFPSDFDNDGYDDDIDVYSDGDAAIKLDLWAFTLNDPVDFGPSPAAELYFALYYDYDGTTKEWNMRQYVLNSDGEPWSVDLNIYFPINYELLINAPDNVERYWIFIYAMDNDFDEDDIIDINGVEQSDKGVLLEFNMIDQTWSGSDSDGVANGSEDGTESSDDDDGILYYNLSLVSIGFQKTYQWEYNGSSFSIDMNFEKRAYIENKSKTRLLWDCQEYVTSDADYIIELSDKLNSTAEIEGFNLNEKADFVLSFVQNIKYSYDNETTESDDYWRYPIETLVEETGDCEDASFLFASLAEAMGYDAVCLYLPGHLAVGIYSETHDGGYVSFEGKEYYYCETTCPGWKMGDIPPDYEEEPVTVYPVE